VRESCNDDDDAIYITLFGNEHFSRGALCVMCGTGEWIELCIIDFCSLSHRETCD